jgi:TetR/AcrR family transcriptional regulator, transcriptional repressor for nem operon
MDSGYWISVMRYNKQKIFRTADGAFSRLMTRVMSGILMAIVIKQVKRAKQRGKRMRVSRERAARNREEILTSAARLFRQRGIGATGVDSITEAAGLTHGGLYSQFGSKQAIVAEAIRFALAGSKRKWRRAAQGKSEEQAFTDIVSSYLSPAHRDARGKGCLVAALSGDIAREPLTVREAFTGELNDALDFLAGLMPAGGRSRRREDAIAAFACMVGALILARAVSDESLSRRILKAAAKRVGKVAKVRAASDRGSQADSRTSQRLRGARGTDR